MGECCSGGGGVSLSARPPALLSPEAAVDRRFLKQVFDNVHGSISLDPVRAVSLLPYVFVGLLIAVLQDKWFFVDSDFLYKVLEFFSRLSSDYLACHLFPVPSSPALANQDPDLPYFLSSLIYAMTSLSALSSLSSLRPGRWKHDHSPALSLLPTMSSSSSSTAGESQTSLLSLSSIDNLLHFPSFFSTAYLPSFVFLHGHRTSPPPTTTSCFSKHHRGRTPPAPPAFFPSSLPSLRPTSFLFLRYSPSPSTSALRPAVLPRVFFLLTLRGTKLRACI